MTTGELIAAGMALIATLASVVGVLGYLRFPDVYTRMHAAGMVATFGTVILLLSTAVLIGVSTGKAMALAVLLLLAAPVASHAMGSAAYRSRTPPARLDRNSLVENADAGQS